MEEAHISNSRTRENGVNYQWGVHAGGRLNALLRSLCAYHSSSTVSTVVSLGHQPCQRPLCGWMSSLLSAGHSGAFGAVGGGAVLGSPYADTASSWAPTVCPASLSGLRCPPVLSHSESLCFPPPLNFGMKMGLGSGTLLYHLMN